MRSHKERNTTKYDVGELIRKFWGSSGFRVTGVFPLNQNIIQGFFFNADNPVIPRVERGTRHQ
jgi:hypothetical protein